MGASALQGPHQAAQKSIITGCSDFSTCWSKLASVISKIASLAIVPPEGSLADPPGSSGAVFIVPFPATTIRCAKAPWDAWPSGAALEAGFGEIRVGRSSQRAARRAPKSRAPCALTQGARKAALPQNCLTAQVLCRYFGVL